MFADLSAVAKLMLIKATVLGFALTLFAVAFFIPRLVSATVGIDQQQLLIPNSTAATTTIQTFIPEKNNLVGLQFWKIVDLDPVNIYLCKLVGGAPNPTADWNCGSNILVTSTVSTDGIWDLEYDPQYLEVGDTYFFSIVDTALPQTGSFAFQFSGQSTDVYTEGRLYFDPYMDTDIWDMAFQTLYDTDISETYIDYSADRFSFYYPTQISPNYFMVKPDHKYPLGMIYQTESAIQYYCIDMNVYASYNDYENNIPLYHITTTPIYYEITDPVINPYSGHFSPNYISSSEDVLTYYGYTVNKMWGENNCSSTLNYEAFSDFFYVYGSTDPETPPPLELYDYMFGYDTKLDELSDILRYRFPFGYFIQFSDIVSDYNKGTTSTFVLYLNTGTTTAISINTKLFDETIVTQYLGSNNVTLLRTIAGYSVYMLAFFSIINYLRKFFNDN